MKKLMTICFLVLAFALAKKSKAEILQISPNGGEELIAGQNEQITWQTNPFVVYFNDFETIGSMQEWSTDSNDVTQGTEQHAQDRFLGEFQNDTVTLTLDNLPPHAEAVLSFDLYLITSWDGIADGCPIGPCGPDEWDVSIRGGHTLLHTTFSNTDIFNRQSYPDSYPGEDYLARTGASENNTLGYPSESWGDSVYTLSFTFPHSDSSLVLDFSALLLSTGPTDERWGLDNIEVSIFVENVSIEYSDDNGIDGSWEIIDSNTPNDGEYEWTVPQVTSNQCLIHISDATDPNVSDTSDDVFTIYVCQGLGLIYREDFDTDPNWITNNADRYYWDPCDGTFVMNQINVNGGGYYAYHETNLNPGSFRLEWDIKMISVDMACAVTFGLFDTDLNTAEHGSFVQVYFVRASGGLTVNLNFMNSENVSQNVKSATQYSLDTWYHVVLEYNASAETFVAYVTLRENGVELITLSASNVGTFTSDMTRVGSSNIREGNFANPGGEATGKIDNVVLSGTNPGPLPADLNDDCYVDLGDFVVLVSHWLECGNPFNPDCY